MKNIFDYIYYRLVKFYFRWDGPDGSTAVIGVSSIQGLSIINIILVILRVLFKKEEFVKTVVELKWLFLLILGIFIVYNHFTSKNKYKDLEENWADEPYRQYVQRGWAVLFALVLPWMFLISFVIITANY